MTARSDELQKAAILYGRAAFFVSWILCLESARRKERYWFAHSLFSCAYFAPDICDKHTIDFTDLKNCRKTYPLRNEWQKNRRQFEGLYRFVYCLAV
jgi:hypothetical protein